MRTPIAGASLLRSAPSSAPCKSCNMTLRLGLIKLARQNLRARRFLTNAHIGGPAELAVTAWTGVGHDGPPLSLLWEGRHQKPK
jgi:hypothetical protein